MSNEFFLCHIFPVIRSCKIFDRVLISWNAICSCGLYLIFCIFVECWPELRRFKKEKRWMRDDHLHLYVFFVYCICALYPAAWSHLIWFDSFLSIECVNYFTINIWKYLQAACWKDNFVENVLVLLSQYDATAIFFDGEIHMLCLKLYNWLKWGVELTKRGAIFSILFYIKLYIVTSSWSSSYEVNGCMPTNEAWHLTDTQSWVS